MFAPVIRVSDGEPVYVNPTLVAKIIPGKELDEKDPGGNPWGSCYLVWPDGSEIHAKGTAQQVLHSWFGPPPTQEQPPLTRQQRRAIERKQGPQLWTPGQRR